MNHGILARQLSAIIASVLAAVPAIAQEAPPTASSGSLGDIVVTARRRSENIQTVPVTVNAFSAERLERATALSLNDISLLTPGLRISSEGTPVDSSISMRGLTKQPVGDTAPGVMIYFDMASLPNTGVDVPTFDLSDVQVLRGPQGTLFGRNALGGAVLLTSKPATYDTHGYAKASYGSYNYWSIEGAQNIPVIDGKLAIRIGGQIRRRDGYEKAAQETVTTSFGAPYNANYSITNPAGKPFGTINQDTLRATILFEPVHGVSNSTVVEYFRSREQPTVSMPYKFNPDIFPLIFGPSLGPVLTEGYNNGIGAAVAQQSSLGQWSTVRVPGINYKSDRDSFALINTTRVDLTSDIYVKNIFAYRRAKTSYVGTIDSIPLIPGPLGTFVVDKPASIDDFRHMVSEEAQLQGTAFDHVLTFTLGGITQWDDPFGAIGTNSNAFKFGTVDVASWNTQQQGNSNQGIYGQVTADISRWTLPGLSLTAGLRNSWDQAYGCGVGLTTGWVTFDQCKTLSTEVKLHDSNKISYTFSLDWRIDRDVFLYAVTRHSYRGVAVNTPLFTSPYTTGAKGACLGGQDCPDLRPLQGTKPDSITDYEIGLKTTWHWNGIQGRFNIDAYTGKYKNEVQMINFATLIPPTAPDNPQSSSVGINAADLRVRGIELDTSIIPVRGLTLSFNGAYTSQVVTKLLTPLIVAQGQHISKPSPKLSGTLSASYTFPFKPLGGELVVSADEFYTSKTFPQNGFPLPGYHVLNTRIDLDDIAGTKFSAGLWIRNALNRRYISAPDVILSSFPDNTATYGEPRMVGFEVGYKW
jgi:iron complex outermembrane receptor protein